MFHRMHFPKTSAVACTVAALLFAARPASAEDLRTALSLEDAGRLSEALEAFEQVLGQQGNSHEELAAIYMHLGLLRFASADREGAARAFDRLLGVAPEAELPRSAPPEVREALAESSRRWGDRRLSAEIEWPDEVVRGRDVSVVVRVVDDVPGFVAAVAIVIGGRTVCDAWGGGPYELSLPAAEFEGGDGQVSVNLLNEHDGVLWTSPSENIADWVFVDHPARAATSARGLGIAGWTLLSVGVVTTVAGGVLAGLDGEPTGQVREGAHEIYDFGPTGWVLVGLGAASIITGVVLLLAGRGARESSTRRSALRLLPGNVAF